MRFLILDSYYPEFLTGFYDAHPGLGERPYREQLNRLYATGFARADHLPRNLRVLGQEADQVIVNAEPLQLAWARENGLRLPPAGKPSFLGWLSRGWQRLKGGLRCYLGLRAELRGWQEKVIAAQVEAYDPDVLFCTDVFQFTPHLLRTIKRGGRYVVLECGYPIPEGLDLSPYDRIVSCDPGYVERFRANGIRADLLRHAFETSVLDRLGPDCDRTSEVVFIGNLTRGHRRRVEMLSAVSEHVPVEIYGNGLDVLTPEVRSRVRAGGPLWGYEMYRRLRSAKITLNIHIDVAGNRAGNMRLYETTGVGTLLVTDGGVNLPDIFEPGKEVVTFSNPQECVDAVCYYLVNESQRQAIALGGQRRTLREHTYLRRMQEFLALL